MALPLSTPNAQESFTQFQRVATNVANLARPMVTAASINANLMASLLSQVMALVTYAQTVAADATLVAAVVAYAQQVSGSTTVQTDFAASLTAIESLQAAILKDYPKDANGFVLDRSMSAAGVIDWIAFTPAQFPTTLPAISAWLATVA